MAIPETGSSFAAAVTGLDTLPSLALGLICAGLGIAIMRGVTLVEQAVRATQIAAATSAIGEGGGVRPHVL